MKSIFLMTVIFSTCMQAMAQNLACEIRDPAESMESDSWQANINSKNMTIQLYSENNIFGENPFAELNLASQKIANMYPKNVLVFTGNNKTRGFKRDTYMIIYDPKEKKITFTANESNGAGWDGKGICRPLRK